MKQVLQFIGLVLAAMVLLSSTATFASPSASKETSTKSKGDSSRPNYIEFPQMMSSVLDGYRVRGMMILGFGLEIEDSHLRDQTRELLPRLQDTYTREFSRYAGSLYRAGEVPNAELISKRMQLATDKMLGKDKAIFLISNLMVRSK